MKFEDGIRLARSVKVELETYARKTGNDMVKPSCSSSPGTRHMQGNCSNSIKSEKFFRVAYKKRPFRWIPAEPAQKKMMIERLLKVEAPTSRLKS